MRYDACNVNPVPCERGVKCRLKFPNRSGKRVRQSYVSEARLIPRDDVRTTFPRSNVSRRNPRGDRSRIIRSLSPPARNNTLDRTYADNKSRLRPPFETTNLAKQQTAFNRVSPHGWNTYTHGFSETCASYTCEYRKQYALKTCGGEKIRFVYYIRWIVK